MINQKSNRLLAVLLVSAGLLSACGPSAEQQATESSLVITQAVETVMVALTQTAMMEPSPTLTIPPTAEPLPTNTPTIEIATYTPFPTQAVTQAGPALSSCDLASFVDDLSIPDGTELAPGQAFTKSWRIKNEGTCTWAAEYQMLYYGGEILSAETAYPLTDHEVAPGDTLDISIEMTAPTTEGTYNMYWILRNADGENFGVDAFGGAFYVQIVVSSGAASFTATPTQDTPTEVPTETPVPSDTPVP
ncbi:MAG: NBR1-Ig-like domain-containing protein [Chloroflexota bacterium]